MQNQCQKNVIKLLKRWGIKFRIGNYKEFFVKRSKYKIFIAPVSEDVAYLLGIICGDGCLKTPQPRKCGGARFTIMIYMPNSTDGEIQSRYLCKLFRKNFGYAPKVYKRMRPGKSWLEVQINSVVVYAYFVSLGLPIGIKYGKLKVPLAVQGKLFKQFLCGLIVSDGHFTKSELVIVQKDKNFLNQIKKSSLKYLGLNFTRPKPNTKKVAGKIYKWYYTRLKTYLITAT